MYENVLGQQPVTDLLREEIQKGCFPPSVLFSGPEASGKLTTAMETARILSCGNDGSWNCPCDSCRRQKELVASDLLIMGSRDAILEIKAAARSFCTAQTQPLRYLFVRAVRKLTCRFDARLWDTDEQRFLKAAPLLASIDEELSDLTAEYCSDVYAEDQRQLEKRVEKITDLCGKLQDDCMYDTIPVNQVRKASAWVRLMPAGKKKVLIVENADKMQDAARNAFLKILEEPPEYAVFILTSSRRAAIIPTILSRVRPYIFAEREAAVQKAVIERVFRDQPFCTSIAPENSINIVSYLQSFLSVTASEFKEAGAFFWEYCFARLKESGKAPPAILTATLNTYRQQRPAKEDSSIEIIVKMIRGGKPHRIYRLFLETLIEFLQDSIRTGQSSAAELEQCARFSQFIQTAVQSVEILNSAPQGALETLADTIILSL